MGNQDFFHEIAKTKHPIDTTDREVPARAVTDHLMRRTDRALLSPVKPLDYEEQKAEFSAELEKMRAYYLPFMSDHLTPLPTQKETRELKTFLFRYRGKEEVFTERDDENYRWEEIEIPDYRGPAGESGKWEAYYKTVFSCPEDWDERVSGGHRIVLAFQCVDYQAEIFVNGNYVGSHEGLFAPFSFDVTKYIREKNELVILCKNDIPILGEGEYLDGDKIYAATGPGWDDPEVGWHHCPAGAGVFGRVSLELRPALYIDDLFVRPDFSKDSVEIRVGVINYTDEVHRELALLLSLEPKNYEGEAIGTFEKRITAVGPGKNEYRCFFPVKNYRLWNPDAPWLYGAKAVLRKQELVLSARVQTAGFKEFRSDEASVPKGKFYLNKKPVMLRGANEMGHLQQCVMKGDFAQLVDDILIAKLCNLNYYRVTQRPVQEEIYDYFDMLGMMHQCDFPLFGFLRRPQFAEALRQVVEMEHLVRRHVSTVMVTLINEPMCIRKTENPSDKFSRRYEAKGHRHLLRDELEAFFSAARKVVYTENPDRVIKNVEGDYDGPTAEGMPDFHTYTMWYTNHGEPIGRLMRGYLPAVKEGWMIGCGEYGAEGLDSEELMLRRYPDEWLRCDERGSWYPDRVVRAQTHSVHGDWYKEQRTVSDWERESQKHQALAAKLMTDAFRRRADVMNQTAIHLLIDAWPSGWMKALVDCERVPKPAYFAYRESLIPLKVNLYTGRSSAYEDETVPVEAWVLNDLGEERNVLIQAEIREESADCPYEMYSEPFQIPAADARCAAVIPVHFQRSGKKRTVIVQAAILDQKKQVLHQEEIRICVGARRSLKRRIAVLGEEARSLLQAYGAESEDILTPDGKDASAASELWLMSGEAPEDIAKLEEHLREGKRAVWLLPEKGMELTCCGAAVSTRSCGEVFFAAADEELEGYRLKLLYNCEKGYIDGTASQTVFTELPGENLIYTYSKQGLAGSSGAKPRLPFVKRCSAAAGTLTLVSLSRGGRIGYNIGLDELLLDLLEEKI